MKKDDFLKKVYDQTGRNVTHEQTRMVYAAICKVARDALLERDEITIHGICTLSSKVRPAGDNRNPATGELVHTPARLLPVCKFNTNMKLAMREIEIDQ